MQENEELNFFQKVGLLIETADKAEILFYNLAK